MDVYEQAAKIISESKYLAVFSGSGISAESGIPTFRDPGGIWDRFDPANFGTVEGVLAMAKRDPNLIREFLLETVQVFMQAKPNDGHIALAEIEEMGFLKSIITQNIDNLHNDAGNSAVYDVHGNLFRARCMNCDERQKLDKHEFLDSAFNLLNDADNFTLEQVMTIMPICSCGGLTRPDVVMFGEAVQYIEESFKIAALCDVMLVLGTSGIVYPAAAIPQQAHQSGAKIIEINLSENSYSGITEVYIQGASGEAMPKIMEHLRRYAE